MSRYIARLKVWLAAIGAAVIAVGFAYFKGVWAGKRKVKGDAAIKSQKAQERGRAAVSRGRASGDTPDERVRANDGRWM